MGFKYDINRYLASHGDTRAGEEPRGDHQVAALPSDGAAPLEQAQEGPENGPETPACKAEAEYREQVRRR